MGGGEEEGALLLVEHTSMKVVSVPWTWQLFKWTLVCKGPLKAL